MSAKTQSPSTNGKSEQEERFSFSSLKSTVKTFSTKAGVFKNDEDDLVGSAYLQVATLIYILGVVVTGYVSIKFSPGVGLLKYIFAFLLFLGLYTVEHGMHASAVILIKASATDRQKRWLVATIVLGSIFIFTDTILLVQSEEVSEIAVWLTKYTSFLIGGEACIIFLMLTRALTLDDRRRAVEYNNGATAQAFYSAVADALHEVRLMALYNSGVRGEHTESMRLSLTALRRGIRSRGSKHTRKSKGIERGKAVVTESMRLVSRDLNDLSSDIAGAIKRLQETGTLDDFLNQSKN